MAFERCLLFLMVALCCTTLVKCQNLGASASEDPLKPYPKSINFTFSEDDVIMVMTDETDALYVNYTCSNCQAGDRYSMTPIIENNGIASIHNYSLPLIGMENGWTGRGYIHIKGVFLGKTTLSFTILDESGRREDFKMKEVYRVNTLRKMRPLDIIFMVVVGLLVACNTIAYACTLDTDVVKDHVKKPIGIIIGFFCQYGFMPVVAFGLAKAFRLQDSLAFGLLCYGASPGGGASNVWTILLRGDLNLSVSMTFFSLISSLAMTSLWVFTLGRQFTGNVVLPFENILISLGSLLLTVVIGLLIKRFAPKVAKILAKIIKPMALVIVLYILTFGTYTNLYIFMLMDSWQVVLSATLVSYIGYILSFTLSVICRRSWKVTRTIVIETGIQNGALAIFMCRYSLPQPDGDLATVAPATALMTNSIPLIIALIIQTIYRKCNGLPAFGTSKKEKLDEENNTKADVEKVKDTANMHPGYKTSDTPGSNLPAISTGHLSVSCPSLTGSGMLHFKETPDKDGSYTTSGYTSQEYSRSSVSLSARSSASSGSWSQKRKSLMFESVV